MDVPDHGSYRSGELWFHALLGIVITIAGLVQIIDGNRAEAALLALAGTLLAWDALREAKREKAERRVE